MGKKKLPLRYKLLMSLVSLIVSLTALEIGLAAVGRMYYQPDAVYRDDETEMGLAAQARPTKTLVAVGDSFTHGGLVEGNETYTHFLRQFLRQQNYQDYRVKNLGICELNSGELLKRMPGILDGHQPHAVLLLVGATNRFNPWDYEAYANKNMMNSMKQSFFNLRVVKMARFIGLTLFAQQEAGQRGMLAVLSPSARSRQTRHDRHMNYLEQWEEVVATNPPDELSQVWVAFYQGDKETAIRTAEEMMRTQKRPGRDMQFALTYFYLRADRPEEAREMVRATTAVDPEAEDILDYRAFYRFELAKWYKKNLQYEKAIDLYLQAIALDPDADYFYYEVNKLFDRQSHYTSQMVYDKLKALAAENPDIVLSKMYQNHLQLYRDKQQWENGIEGWIRHDLDKIAALCRRRGTKLIIQNYPVSYPLANKVLEEIAQKYSLPVVDHLSRFQKLEPKNDYFFDDDHCTRTGHQIMAENVLETLVKSQTITHEHTN